MKSVCILSALVLQLLAISCADEEVVHQKVTVKLTPTLEISQSETANVMKAMAETSPSTIYAVQIYNGKRPIYYGLFNEPDSMKIALSTNTNYFMKMTAYQTGTGSGLRYKNINGELFYYLPQEVKLENKFVADTLFNRINHISTAILTDDSTHEYPEVDAFYTEKSFQIFPEEDHLNFDLKRIGFAIDLNVKGLKSGKIIFYFDHDEIVLTPENQNYYSIRSFTGEPVGLGSVAFNDTYFEQIPVTAKWFGTNGMVISTTSDLKFLRNCEVPVSINLNTINSQIILEDWYTESDTIDISKNISQ